MMSLISYRNTKEEGRSYFRMKDREDQTIDLIIGRDDQDIHTIIVADTPENRKTIDEIKVVITTLTDVLDTKADFEYRVKKEIEFAFGQQLSKVIENPTIENNFSYHPPKEGQPEIYELIRSKGKELAYLLESTVPNSREKSLAMTKLEESIFWANAGVARN